MEIQSSTGTAQLTAALTQKGTAAAVNPTPITHSAPVETAKAVSQVTSTTNMTEVAQAVKSLNKAMQKQAPNLEFSIDTDTNRTVVKLIDKTSGEVLRQIPSQEALEITKALDQSIGLLIRHSA